MKNKIFRGVMSSNVTNFFILFLVLTLVMYGCKYGIVRPTEIGDKNYPAIVKMSIPCNQVHAKIVKFLKENEMRIKPGDVFSNQPTNNWFHVEMLENNQFAKQYSIFSHKENIYDIFIHNYGEQICISNNYLINNKPAEYYAEFHLHMQEIDKNTTILTMFSYRNMIPGGYIWCAGHDGVKSYPELQEVSPTGIEEKELLNYIIRHSLNE